MRDQLVNALMDAQGANARQDRALYNPTPEVDSALEHAAFLLRTANDVQRPHAVALVRALREVHGLNRAEREHVRVAAGIADPIGNVHEYVRAVRPLLADLLNPILPPATHAARVAELHAVFGRTRPGSRRSVSVRHLLGVRKFTRLVEEHDEWLERLDAAQVAEDRS